MSTIEELQRKLQEEKRLREEAESRALEEQRQRENAESRALEEQHQRENAESRALEEQHQRENAESRALEEQRRREKAEELSQPQTVRQYLEACHSLNLAIQVVTNPSLTTQGHTTDPSGRTFPRRIIPWDSFATGQEEIWNDLSVGDLFFRPNFPSKHQLQYVKSMLRPISSELGLRFFQHDVVENAIQTLVDTAYMDPLLRNNLGLKGTVTFESHLNLGTTKDDVTSESQQHKFPGEEDAGAEAEASASVLPPKPKTPPKARHKGNRKSNLADQFCVYRTLDGQNIPVLAIEYKPPHKLTLDEIVTGLQSEIQPDRDVINKDGQDFAFAARALATAVITQLFSYMIGKSLQYGYVCTGEAFVFLYIPDNPATVYFSVCVPNRDVVNDDETRLHRTAVAQVFAFILQAFRAKPLPELWHDEANKLDTWPVEREDILSKIPVSERKRKEPPASPYKPQRWKGFKRSPIRTRSSCKQLDADAANPEEDDENPPSPSPNPSLTGGKVILSKVTGLSSTDGEQGRHQKGQQQVQGQTTKTNVRDRSFCTQECLLGLAYGGPMDTNCPNSSYHGKTHIRQPEFLRLIRGQLAADRGYDADCAPLYLSGARGALFKVRLSSHGYTLVAKGMESLDRGHLQHEIEIYKRLEAIQGKHIPVCLGGIDLILPYHYDSGVYMHFMFLSWAGRRVFESHGQVNKTGIINAVTTILKAVHGLGILHRDAEPRNILYDAKSGNFMVVDFERAEFRGCQASSSIVFNNQAQKRKRGMSQKQEKDDFEKELEFAEARILRWTAISGSKLIRNGGRLLLEPAA